MKKSLILVYLIFVLAAADAFGQCATSSVSPCINNIASRQFGQSPNAGPLNQPLVSANPNLVEGREFWAPYSIAFDARATPPIMYVADAINTRVLAFKNPNNLAPCGISAPTCGFADIVIGENSFFATIQGGRNITGGLSTGFALPSGVAVDGSGNLYVVDSGNNRVLRFPRANILSGVLPVQPDLVIGQKTFTAISANQGNSSPSATSLALNNGSGIAIDSSNNVWIADTANNRVLRFPTTNLTSNAPQADLVLGQFNFTTNALPAATGLGAAVTPNLLDQPFSLAFDNQGRLYVSDTLGRVLFFQGPFNAGVNGASAANILGIYLSNVNPTQLGTPNQYQLGLNGKSLYLGLFTNGTNLFVVDAGNNRIVEYDQPQNWGTLAPLTSTSPTSQFSPAMIAVVGQADLKSNSPNQGNAEPSNSTFNFTTGFGGGVGGGVFNGTDLWIADTGNNRVLSFPQSSSGAYTTATRLVGQLDYPYFQPNLIEGRESFLVSPASTGGDVAVDLSSGATAPHLYIADTFNNRILGFRDARNVQPGQKADLVIGQQDIGGNPGSRFYRALFNSPKNDPQIPVQTGLSQPSGVVVDSAGNLWVADTGNGRVLRFRAPFSPTASLLPDVVLGQPSFTTTIPSVSQNGMTAPFGLAIFSDGSLAVSDPAANRILIFKKGSSGDFTSSQAASVVLGQAGFNNSTASPASSGLNNPRHMAVDSSDRLYVADIGNNRMQVFGSPAQTNATAQFTLNGVTPLGVAVSGSGQTNAGIGQGTGEIFLALGNGQVWKLPEFSTLELESINQQTTPIQAIGLQATPTALTLDRSGNLVVADASNRTVFFYPQLNFAHAASLNSQPVAPGQLTYFFRAGDPFSFNGDFVSTTYPWPTVANDVQVTVAGTAAPIFLIINEGPYLAIQVPTTAPTTGTADVLITHPSTGEILGAATIPMQQYNPGFFTVNELGTGQVAATNGADNTENSSTNGVSRAGTATIQFCLTGGGPFTGGPDAAPADGSPYTGSTGAKTQGTPQMLNGSFNGGLADANLLKYSGAGLPGHGCNFPGGWEIDWTVSNKIPPSSTVGPIPISIQMPAGGVSPTTSGTTTFVSK